MRPEGWNWRRSETTDISRVAADHRDGKDVALRPETDYLGPAALRADLDPFCGFPELSGDGWKDGGRMGAKKKFHFFTDRRASARARATA